MLILPLVVIPCEVQITPDSTDRIWVFFTLDVPWPSAADHAEMEVRLSFHAIMVESFDYTIEIDKYFLSACKKP